MTAVMRPEREERPVEQRRPRREPAEAAWACGLSPDEAAHAGDRCRDVVPELIVELI